MIRLAEVPGFGVDSAQQVISEVGVQAGTLPSAAELTSWGGTCPGKDESAEQNHSSRSAKGNKYLRRVLNQAAHAAVKKKGSHFQAVFRRLLPRLGYQSAIWAIAHRLCRVAWKILHEGVRFIEQGTEPDPKAKKQRARMLARALRKLGYEVAITPINPASAENGMQMEEGFSTEWSAIWKLTGDANPAWARVAGRDARLPQWQVLRRLRTQSSLRVI